MKILLYVCILIAKLRCSCSFFNMNSVLKAGTKNMFKMRSVLMLSYLTAS